MKMIQYKLKTKGLKVQGQQPLHQCEKK